MKNSILTLALVAALTIPALAELLPRVTSWSKGEMSVTATIKGEKDDIIDGLVKAINMNGGTIADSDQLGSTVIIKTDWFAMPHNVWAYDCKLSFNLTKGSAPGHYTLVSRGSLRAQIDGSHVTDNEIRPFLRKLIKSLARGGWPEL
jgi:hypothetical protein